MASDSPPPRLEINHLSNYWESVVGQVCNLPRVGIEDRQIADLPHDYQKEILNVVRFGTKGLRSE